MTTPGVSHYPRVSTSAPFNTPSCSQKTFFSPLNLHRSPLLWQAFEGLPSKSFVQPDAAFVGHSLGELSALPDILLNSSLVDVVICCVLTMQCAVESDEQVIQTMLCTPILGRVGKTFDDAALREMV
jgi:hypothetical protein